MLAEVWLKVLWDITSGPVLRKAMVELQQHVMWSRVKGLEGHTVLAEVWLKVLWDITSGPIPLKATVELQYKALRGRKSKSKPHGSIGSAAVKLNEG